MLRLREADHAGPWLIPGLPEEVLAVSLEPIELTAEFVIQTVFAYYGISSEYIRGRNRKPENSKARQVSIWFLGNNTKMTLEKIGQCFGGRDHSTVIYAKKNVAGFLHVERKLKKKPYTTEINELKELLGIYD